MSDSLSQEQVNELATVLRQQRNALETQLSDVEESVQPVTLDQQSVGRVSRIDAITQQQMDTARKQHAQDSLRAIMVALSRVESGDYGFCVDCDDPIGYARLVVKPETALCLSCAGKREGR